MDNQETRSMQDAPLIGLTGGTGYVGGRLLPILEAQGRHLRCLARRPERLQSRVGSNTEAVAADVLDRESLIDTLDGVDVAYYLIHNMSDTGDFEQKDRQAALNFAAASRQCGVKRIIYLGGLGDPETGLSKHLRSRQEVGRILREESNAQVIELRASIIIGSGSLSFELIRALVERLPVMICPRWVSTPTQPIAIEDVLAYLAAALDFPDRESRIIEIGGPDQVSYGDLMQEYAKQRGLKRKMVSVPVLTPHLSSMWLGLVTPIYARIGEKLIDGLRHPTIVRDKSGQELFPIKPRGLSEAIQRAIAHEDHEMAETRWFDAVSAGSRPPRWGGERYGSRLIDTQVAEVDLPREEAFEPIQEIGGEKGWYFGDWLWNLRGAMDIFFGGVGMRRGRRDPKQISVGDPLDFWRVESIDPGKKLRLAAEMRLPGRAWLEFEVAESEEDEESKPSPESEKSEEISAETPPSEEITPPEGEPSTPEAPAEAQEPEAPPHKKRHTQIRQTAIFDPIGLGGLVYWYALYPVHKMVFKGMLRGITQAAKKQDMKGV